MRRVAKVLFEGNPKPYYFNTEINNLKRGEIVIAETTFGLYPVTFCEYRPIHLFKKGSPTKWILCREKALTENIEKYQGGLL